MEKELTCVSCSFICVPPEKIYQCEEGDLLCHRCKDDVNIAACPECRTKLQRPLARNKALEKMAWKHLGANII